MISSPSPARSPTLEHRHDATLSILPSESRAEVEFDNARHAQSGAQLKRELSSSSISENPHSRVQSVHGVVDHHLDIHPGQEGRIVQKPESEPRFLSTEELAAERNREEDLGTQRKALNEADWYEKRSPTSPSRRVPLIYGQQPESESQQRTFSPPQSSLRSQSPSSETSPYQQLGYAQHPTGAQMHTDKLSPQARSSSYSNTPQQQFPERQRISLVDSGSVCGASASSPVTSVIRRAVSDSNLAPGSPNQFGFGGSSSGRGASGGITPPLRRSPRGLQAALPPSPAGSQPASPATPRYATFEDMGIRGRGIAEVEKDDKECIIISTSDPFHLIRDGQ